MGRREGRCKLCNKAYIRIPNSQSSALREVGIYKTTHPRLNPFPTSFSSTEDFFLHWWFSIWTDVNCIPLIYHLKIPYPTCITWFTTAKNTKIKATNNMWRLYMRVSFLCFTVCTVLLPPYQLHFCNSQNRRTQVSLQSSPIKIIKGSGPCPVCYSQNVRHWHTFEPSPRWSQCPGRMTWDLIHR